MKHFAVAKSRQAKATDIIKLVAKSGVDAQDCIVYKYHEGKGGSNYRLTNVVYKARCIQCEIDNKKKDASPLLKDKYNGV